MPTRFNKATGNWTEDFKNAVAVTDAFNLITSVRANLTQVRSTIDNEKWTNALFRLIEVKRQLGELEAIIKHESGLMDEASYLRVAQGKEQP